MEELQLGVLEAEGTEACQPWDHEHLTLVDRLVGFGLAGDDDVGFDRVVALQDRSEFLVIGRCLLQIFDMRVLLELGDGQSRSDLPSARAKMIQARERAPEEAQRSAFEFGSGCRAAQSLSGSGDTDRFGQGESDSHARSIILVRIAGDTLSNRPESLLKCRVILPPGGGQNLFRHAMWACRDNC